MQRHRMVDWLGAWPLATALAVALVVGLAALVHTISTAPPDVAPLLAPPRQAAAVDPRQRFPLALRSANPLSVQVAAGRRPPARGRQPG